MSPLLPGIIASGISGHLYTPEGSAYEIAKFTVPSGGVSSAIFSIPSGYRHLRIESIARTTNSEVNLFIKFNNDDGNNYSGHYLYGDGSSAASGSLATPTGPPFIGRITSSSATANVFGEVIIDVLDYSSSTKNKTIKSLSGYDNNGSGQVFLISGQWMNTNPIVNMEISVTGSNSIAENSTFTLIGYK